MPLRALLALLFCAFAFFGGAGAFGGQALHDGTGDECKLDCCNEAEGRSGNDAAQNKTAHGCCDATRNQDGCCPAPTRGHGTSTQHLPTTATAQAAQLKARRAPMRAAAGSLFYALLLTATTPDAAPQALARATTDPVLATPTPALRVTQCRWQV